MQMHKQTLLIVGYSLGIEMPLSVLGYCLTIALTMTIFHVPRWSFRKQISQNAESAKEQRFRSMDEIKENRAFFCWVGGCGMENGVLVKHVRLINVSHLFFILIIRSDSHPY